MKTLIILFLLVSTHLFPQQFTISGLVSDAETGLPLRYANIILTSDNNIGTTTDINGMFKLKISNLNDDTLIVSYLGCYTSKIPITESHQNLSVRLQPKILPSQSVLIKGSIGRKGESPFVYDKIRREEIKQNYSVQDIPEYLGALPSTTFYSESGNGIGYNYISIRGFDQRRITVAINGIPQNDPEDHNVYWLDFPDILANTELIQVQRGSGSGLYGYPAIGGAINIITSPYTINPQADFSTSIGSYNTRKYSAAFSSGIINEKYSFSGKLSRILSSGYREKSFVKFSSYYFSASRFDENITTQINFFGGPIEDGLAYTGLPKFAVKDKELRTGNFSAWDKNIDGVSYSSQLQSIISFDKIDTVYAIPRRPDEVENFSQPHFELLNEINLDENITLNSALFLIIGQGFFDYDASWADTSYLRLTNEFGFNPVGNPGNVLIRAQVENIHYGFIPRINIKHTDGELIIGGEFRIHRSDHWGSIGYGENLPTGLTKDYRYYFYNGGKDVINGFLNENYKLNDNINLLGEIQVAYHKYRIENERYVGNNFSISDVFINPRMGISYKFDADKQIYLSLARVTREPRLKNYYDAAESSYGATPQFESITDTSGNIIYNFNNPLVKPETMNDIELGGSISNPNFNISLNLFLMLFENEIVSNGQLDRFGQPVTGNVESSQHKGVELSALYKFNEELKIYGNVTYSLNTIEEGKDYLNTTEFIDLSGNRIGGFPDYLANFGIQYSGNNITLHIDAKYVGDFYSDNYDKKLISEQYQAKGFVDYSDNKNDAYFVTNIFASYKFKIFDSLSEAKIFFQLNNVFDNLYSAHATGKEFFPAAERNFIGGVQFSL